MLNFENPVSVEYQVSLARLYGRCGAVVYMAVEKECDERPIRINGDCWCVLSQERLADLTGYSIGSVKRAVKMLVGVAVLEVACFNQDKFDRTRWYRLTN